MSNHEYTPSQSTSYEGPLRLTRRGKVVAGAALALSLFGVAEGAKAIGEMNQPHFSEKTISYPVQPGDTLWNIATEHYPEVNPVDTIADISSIPANKEELSDGVLQSGEILQLPEEEVDR